MASKPPDLETMKARKGQKTDVVVEDLYIGDLGVKLKNLSKTEQKYFEIFKGISSNTKPSSNGT